MTPFATIRGELAKVQDQFNAWAQETRPSNTALSRIAAISIGPDHAVEELPAMADGED